MAGVYRDVDVHRLLYQSQISSILYKARAFRDELPHLAGIRYQWLLRHL